MPLFKPRPELNFLRLQTAVFCAECELIHENNTATCLACGSSALLSVSRVFGGSLRHQPTATLLQDAAMERLVRELIESVPVSAEASEKQGLIAARSAQEAPGTALELPVAPAQLDLEPAISVIAERAQALTGASGSAIGLRWGKEVVCSARAGRTAPDLGVRLRTDAGLSGECLRTGQILRCDDTEDHAVVDRGASRRLGVRSILVAPLQHFRKTLGIFEVLSSESFAFDDLAVANLQMLAGFMVAAIARAAGTPAMREQL
ncbi:MAG TPA: GAF domain-containing protein [Terriglobales bacterium]|nr:GAF domain-containing protein [Terriglobales bacterium]